MNLPLPTIKGVGPSCLWLPPGNWETVLAYLSERFPKIETEIWVSRMARGLVVDQSGDCLNPKSLYRVGACLFYYRELSAEPKIPFEESVIYQDEHLLVADKPPFLPVVPAGRFLHETLLVRLRKKGNHEHLVPLHRIDRETAGIVLFSLNPATRGSYASLFNNRKIKKSYQALALTSESLSFPIVRRSLIVTGEPFFRMKEIEGEPNAETHILLLKKWNDTGLYQLTPITGKKHQIRLHMATLGIPIINERLYPKIRTIENDCFSTPLQLLAKAVSFEDPLTGQERYFESNRTLER